MTIWNEDLPSPSRKMPRMHKARFRSWLGTVSPRICQGISRLLLRKETVVHHAVGLEFPLIHTEQCQEDD